MDYDEPEKVVYCVEDYLPFIHNQYSYHHPLTRDMNYELKID